VVILTEREKRLIRYVTCDMVWRVSLRFLSHSSLPFSPPGFRRCLQGYVYSDPECFASGLVDHTVTIIGYDTRGRCRFGLCATRGAPSGARGDMRLAISGGQGTCGINTTPAMYPVVQGPLCRSPFSLQRYCLTAYPWSLQKRGRAL